MNTQVPATTQPRALKPAEEFKRNLGLMTFDALPKNISADKFRDVVMTAVQKNPKLLEADRQSLYLACRAAAADGLLPDGREGAIVEFGGKATWMPMVAGIFKRVRNSGELASVDALIVYEKELEQGKFNYWVDNSGPHIEHRPILFGDRGKAIGAYAMATTKDGILYVRAMNEAEINKRKEVSRAKNGALWTTWQTEAWLKTVLRALAKRLPQSTDLEQLLERDKELFTPDEQAGAVVDGVTGEVTQAPAAVPPKRKRRVDAIKDAPTPEPQPAAAPEPEQQEIPGFVANRKKEPEPDPVAHAAPTDAEYEDVI